MRNYVKEMFEALDRGRRFVAHDVWYIGRPGEEVPHGLIIKQVRVLILLVRNLLQGAFLMRAAALTFTSLLSIVPCIAILFIIIQKLNLGVYAVGLVLDVAPREATAVQAPIALPATDQNEEVIRAFLRWVFADVSVNSEELKNVNGVQQMDDPIESMLRFARSLAAPDQANSGTVIGLVGFVLVTVFGMMWNIESAFNAIWGVRRTRSWVRIFSDYVVILLFLPFVIAGVLGLMIALENPQVHLGPAASILRMVQYGSVWAAFSILYAIVPNTKVKWRYALLGGVIAGTLWCLGSWGYLLLQIGVARTSMIYSSFALFPLLMTWVYISWIILLFGAELTFAYQNEQTFAMERHAAGASYAYREAVGLRAMVEISHRFDEGMPGMTTEQAARDWNVPTRVINETLDQLEEAGLVSRCATEPVTYRPARSLEKITVWDVVRSLRESGREPSALREDELLRPLLDEVEGRDRVLLGATLDTLSRRFHPLRAAIEVLGSESKELPEPARGPQ
ncbi:MAG TPA: YhjD/YihY/BrkB family envelope integrity protein [Candidatus Hydrogenedentes bacterium]|nr:YhjD/YihY/BrkB family envelope integrity protein [Candidatus Hydrogenedentota bacterium]HRK34360.1 YhjD/YihY/BrkB family envelope integrity protein [Candidatus Hydrogenedentota bacterium]